MARRLIHLACLLCLGLAHPVTASQMSIESPARGKIPVAFLISQGADVIDWAGPWEVFQNARVPGRGISASDTRPFELYVVAETKQPVAASGGLMVVPDYSFADAPQPSVIVVPAQGGVTPALLEWLRTRSAEAQLTMSVCTGAAVLARAGLLDGREATTHHGFLNQFERSFPQVHLRRDVRWVEGRRIATAAGLTSGLDLALRVVTRYFGEEIAAQTAEYMEYRSEGWRAARGHTTTFDQPVPRKVGSLAPQGVLKGLDPVHLAEGREVAGKPEVFEVHQGLRYHFASERTRQTFRAASDRYSIQLGAACARMANQGAPPGSGDVDRFFVHQGRIFVFASEGCRREFRADPSRYLEAPSQQTTETSGR